MTLDNQNLCLTSPYTFTGYQHKVQLHAHTTRSDGSHDPQWVMQGYAGMEIYNGASCGQAEILACFPPAVDYMLVSGRRLLLIATDNFHTDMDLGYVVINSPAPPQALVLDHVARALRDGNFFAVGRMDPEAALAPHFTDIRVERHPLTVTVDQPADPMRRGRHQQTGTDATP